jgi:t-SNARE complex subunit (syntaxin)
MVKYIFSLAAGGDLEPLAALNTQSQTQRLISFDQTAELDMLEERKNAVQSLEKEIRDVNDIFKDLAMLVHEQGEVMDSIEASIETGDLNLSAGLDELERARRKANKRRVRRLIMYSVLGIFAGILILSVAFGSMK